MRWVRARNFSANVARDGGGATAAQVAGRSLAGRFSANGRTLVPEATSVPVEKKGGRFGWFSPN
jgi:hypothetical protein